MFLHILLLPASSSGSKFIRLLFEIILQQFGSFYRLEKLYCLKNLSTCIVRREVFEAVIFFLKITHFRCGDRDVTISVRLVLERITLIISTVANLKNGVALSWP